MFVRFADGRSDCVGLDSDRVIHERERERESFAEFDSLGRAFVNGNRVYLGFLHLVVEGVLDRLLEDLYIGSRCGASFRKCQRGLYGGGMSCSASR